MNLLPPGEQFDHRIAVASEHVVADVVDVDALPELAHEYKVTSVPKTLVNASVELLGSQCESSLVDAIETVGRDQP